MSRAISSYPEHQRAAVVARRAKLQTGGIGYWAAVDAQRKLAAKQYREEQARRVNALREAADLMRSGA